MADDVIVCEHLVKDFGDVRALDDLDLTVGRGSVVGYLGANGAGKSTTIRILVDLARPTGGTVRVLGSDPRAGGPALRRRIGYLPGELRLDDRLHVDETLRMWARLRGGVDQTYVDELCERLDLDPTRLNRTLSSGNRRKVGLVGAFMSRPELMILDEPTSGVDPLVQSEFGRLVDEARGEGRTVFLSSHVLGEVRRLADEVVVIRRGSLVARGSLEDLGQATHQPFTIWFHGEVPGDELRSLPGVSGLRIRGDEATGMLEGEPNDLIRFLADHEVIHLHLPEPDLEEAFLDVYEGRVGNDGPGGER